MKILKQFFLLVFSLILSINLFAQDCNLSTEARRYWVRGITAANNITSDDDYQFAADEFEKALQYEPKCSDIYYNLIKLYGQIGLKKGKVAFDKATSYLESYKYLKPTDESAKDLLAELEIKQEKYERDLIIEQQKEKEEIWASLKQLEGKWTTEYGALGDFDIIIDSNSAQIVPKNTFADGKLEYSYSKANIVINSNNTYSFFIEGIWHHNAGAKMGGGSGPQSDDFTTYVHYIGTLELTNDGQLKCSCFLKLIEDVDNITKRHYLYPNNYSLSKTSRVDYYQKSH